ncbi:MAG: hypothetical protein IJ786_01660 [Bacteroidaceae bacterium]|nr:hypothetical protein [Bacteroidaceae bacterium]
MKHVLYLLLLFAFALNVAAQKPVNTRKAYKPIRTALKAKNGSEALRVINTLLTDSAYSHDPKLYAYAIESELLLCEGFNEKMYLGQSIDTAQFFQANYDLMQFILRCDSAEVQQATTVIASDQRAKGRTVDSYRKQNAQLLLQYFPNMSAAGRFHYGKRQYAQARKYFEQYFSLPKHPMWTGDTLLSQTQTYRENTYLAFRTMYELGQYDALRTHSSVLLADSTMHAQVLDMLIAAARQQNDSVTYFQLLKQALDEQPNRLDYFSVLANSYIDNGDYVSSLQLADTLLSKDPFNKYYLECRCLSLFRLGRIEESKIAAERLVEADTCSAEAYYVLGYYYVEQAEHVQLPAQTRSSLYKSAKNRQAAFYTQARPYLERFRALMPEETALWAPLLYKVYLNLNLGKEFEEINQSGVF